VWLLTTRGLYSVVAHRDDPALVLVRARVEADLLALRDLTPGIEPWHDPRSEYPWRAELPRDEWVRVAAALAEEVGPDDAPVKSLLKAVDAPPSAVPGDGAPPS
jgi:hypothetical protein